MKIFNIGSLELILILIVALIVLGPKRAVKTAKDIGQWVRKVVNSPLWRDIVSTSNEIREFPKKIIKEAGLEENMVELNISTENIDKDMQEMQAGLKGEIDFGIETDKDVDNYLV